MTQPTLPLTDPMTLADLDEWIGSIETTGLRYGVHHWPNDWARSALAGILGEEIPHRSWNGAELLALLTRAKACVAPNIDACGCPVRPAPEVRGCDADTLVEHERGCTAQDQLV